DWSSDVCSSDLSTWQQKVSSFIQSSLKCMPDVDFGIKLKNSDDPVKDLHGLHGKPYFYASLDIVDLYFSLDYVFLFNCLKERIQNFVLDFRNSVGMSLDSFLEIVTFHLNSTVIEFNDDLFIQKSGICIGSCIAPVLSELYLEH